MKKIKPKALKKIHEHIVDYMKKNAGLHFMTEPIRDQSAAEWFVSTHCETNCYTDNKFFHFFIIPKIRLAYFLNQDKRSVIASGFSFTIFFRDAYSDADTGLIVTANIKFEFNKAGDFIK